MKQRTADFGRSCSHESRKNSGRPFLPGISYSRTRFQPLPTQERTENSAAVRAQAFGALYLFKRDDVAKAVAEKTSTSSALTPVEIPNIESLSFRLTEEPSGDAAKAEHIRFRLQGEANLVWLFDEKSLKTALLGKPKAELASALSAFPTISKADLVLRPFWSRSFPEEAEKVTIERTLIEQALPAPAQGE